MRVVHDIVGIPTMSYVEREGIWHIVARTEDAEAVTVCATCG